MEFITMENGWEVRYPSSPVFVFNRILINVSTGGGEGEHVHFHLLSSYPEYRDERVTDQDGIVNIDISRYMQLCFDKATIHKEHGPVKDIEFEITSGTSDAIERISLTCIWGGISPGEKIKDRVVRYFTAFKNPVSHWLLDNSIILERGDNERFVKRDDNTVRKIIEVLNLENKDYKNSYIVKQIVKSQKDKLSSFDSTFDYTFWDLTSFDGILTTTIIFDCSRKGTYLKWIDNTGMWNYYLFANGKDIIATSDIGEEYDTFQMLEPVVGFYGVYNIQGKVTRVKKTLCASLVGKEERSMLSTILSSPLVYWCPYPEVLEEERQWFPIRVEASSMEIGQANLDDFIFTVQLPNKTVQRL